MTRRGIGGNDDGTGENHYRSTAGQGADNNRESSFLRHETGDAVAGHRRQPQRPTTGEGERHGELNLSTSSRSEGDDEDNDRHHKDEDDDDDLKNHHHLTKPDYLSDEGDSAAIAVPEDENCLARFRRKCGEAVNHPRVQMSIVALIAVNALMMGIGTFDFIKNYPDRERAFELTDRCFLMIFTIELFVQFIYRGSMLLTDGWLVFDLVIIVTSWAFAELQIIRAFRIFRALRLITRVQVMQNLVIGTFCRRPLTVPTSTTTLTYPLLSALFGVMPRMVAIGLLLFLVSYIFAVMFTQLFKDLYERGKTDADYFGRLDETFCELVTKWRAFVMTADTRSYPLSFDFSLVCSRYVVSDHDV
jgi:uncharacterized membrane protein YphA (DoxX/SURF4 family)